MDISLIKKFPVKTSLGITAHRNCTRAHLCCTFIRSITSDHTTTAYREGGVRTRGCRDECTLRINIITKLNIEFSDTFVRFILQY